MHVYNYAYKILSLNYHRELYGLTSEKQIQRCLQVKNGKMTTTLIRKSKFPQLNDKRFYFSDNVVLLPFAHPLLSELNSYKQNLGEKIEEIILQEKSEMLN